MSPCAGWAGCDRNMARTAEAVIGNIIPYRETARRPGDPPVLVADPGLAAELLGWAPTIELDEGLRRTVEHFRTATT